MKTTTLYTCEFCGTSYADKNVCKNCEASHKTPVGIEKCKYQSVKSNATGYPLKIDVKMSDGKIVQYHR